MLLQQFWSEIYRIVISLFNLNIFKVFLNVCKYNYLNTLRNMYITVKKTAF